MWFFIVNLSNKLNNIIKPNWLRADHISNTSYFVQLVCLFCGLPKSVVRIILINILDLPEAVSIKRIGNVKLILNSISNYGITYILAMIMEYVNYKFYYWSYGINKYIEML